MSFPILSRVCARYAQRRRNRRKPHRSRDRYYRTQLDPSLYEAHKLKKINAALIDSWLDEGNTAIHDAVVEQIRQVHYKSLKTTDFDSFTTELKIAATNIEILVGSNLEAERNSYCETDFIFIENEYKVNTIEENISWKLSDTLDLNFYMSIDRVDEIAPNVRRFIDFKTGVEETSISDLNNIFTSYKNEKSGIFQLLLYCEAYMSLRNSNVDIQPVLHPLRKLVSSPKINFISVGKTKDLKYSRYATHSAPCSSTCSKEFSTTQPHLYSARTPLHVNTAPSYPSAAAASRNIDMHKIMVYIEL